MAHGIYFSAKNDREGFRIPVNPEAVTVKASGDGEEFDIAGTGKVNVPKSAMLEEYQFNSFFPARETHYSPVAFREPHYYIDNLKRWRKEKTPIRFMYVDGSFTVNELVTIEEFEYDETGGDADVNYTLNLKQYIPFGPKKMKVVSKTPGKAVVKKPAPPRENTKAVPATYSLVAGDSLWKVAKKFLGDGARYREIANLNGIKDSQFRKLPIGLKIKLPAK